ncbi:MerR family transcriptional regulator [Rhodococcus sp. IEGM 1351]|uniref:MerR family transcriptional regulator n=1 Tax=Rhodococcus sp. IEGM 1351 TaxID=3047089 RepID=UPI0024B7AF2E|nr:MerR family transcriptional regulator [Rhodococcus sp. IEGM 1351]MDI9937676.1 MerR family transcriptional regulator [Rhodococcus sp. IEGM 1351]
MLIGEVSRRCGVSTRMLRHYDTLGLVKPTGRTSGGYREYSTDDIRRLFHVESLRTLGLSLNEAKRALDEPDFAPADLVGDLIRHTRRRIAAEEELLGKLERVDAASPAEWEDVLRIVGLLRALESESAARRQQAILSQDGTAALPVEALVEAILSEDDPNVAGALQWSLARVAGPGLEVLADGLDAEDADVRRRATAAIAAIHTAEATAHLRRALDDPEATVRGYAALALGSRGNVDAIPSLIELVVEGRRDVEAAEVLGLLTTVSASADAIVEVMQDTLDNTEDAPTRLRITQALAEIPGTAARRALDRLAHDGDRTIASTAASILNTLDRGRSRRRRSGIGTGVMVDETRSPKVTEA